MPVEPTPAESRRKTIARKSIAFFCVLTSLAYVVNTIWSHEAEIRAAMQNLKILGVIVMFLMATFSIAITTSYHSLLLNQYTKTPIQLSHSGAAYAIGQIIRYLPGKIWGVVFEANYLRGFADVQIVSIALLVQTIFGYYWAFVLASVILLAEYQSTHIGYLILVPAVWFLWILHRQNLVYRLLSAMPVLRRYIDREARAPFDRSTTVKLCFLLLLNWLPFLAGWACMLNGIYSVEKSIAFGAAYIIASIASTALIVVPSGIVVREAIFTAIGAAVGLPVPDLLLYGLVIRVALTLADVMNAGIYAVSDRFLRNI